MDVNKIDSLDSFLRYTSKLGSTDRALTNNLYGLDHIKVTPVRKVAKERYGYIFFSRPMLNLSNSNIRRDRRFLQLANENQASSDMYARAMLDPRLMKNEKLTGINCPLVDSNQAFIPLLTNNATSVSGWPDLVTPIFSSKEGVRGEKYSQTDGTKDFNGDFDLDVTFENTDDNALSKMMSYWSLYSSLVFEGKMIPYLDKIAENEIDYNTRIFRIVMDETNTYVSMIGSAVGIIPLNDPMGKMFDYNIEKPLAEQIKELNYRFKCMFPEYNDDILIREFNSIVGIFNPNIKMLNDGETNHGLEKIPANLRSMLRNRGYPRINEETYELEWYIESENIEFFLKESEEQ